MRLMPTLATALALLATSAVAQSPALTPDQTRFRAIYKELVETNTQFSNGDCTLAANRMAAHLRSAGFPAADVTVWVPDGHPKEGAVTAILRGTDAAAKPILLLGHLDVVEARREDWTRDPYTLIEEDGVFYGRGTVDMKAMDAVWVDTFIRLREGRVAIKRTLKLALTCGEEGGAVGELRSLNGATWMVQNHPETLSAEFGLTEGGGGALRADGTNQFALLQVGEKGVANFTLEVTNPGGHSSRPVPDNAIYRLAGALKKIEAYRFPLKFNATTRGLLTARATENDAPGQAVKRLLANPKDAAAERAASADPSINNRLRTTCIATQLSGGHAANALPQRANATINCRVFPGETLAEVTLALTRAIGDPQVKITPAETSIRTAINPPLSDFIVEPAPRLARKYFPGAMFTPTLMAGATDARAFGPLQMPIYGPPGLFTNAESGLHGLNEHIPVKSVMTGRDYLYELVVEYANQPAR